MFSLRRVLPKTVINQCTSAHRLLPNRRIRSTQTTSAPFQIPPPVSIPGPGPSPGEAYMEWMSMGGFSGTPYAMNALRKKYGDVVRLQIPGQPSVVVFDPEDIKLVYNNEGKYPVGTAQIFGTMIQELMGGGVGLVSAPGPVWKELRTLIQKDITPPAVAHSYLKLLEPTVEGLINNIEQLNKMEDGFVLISMDLFHTILYGKDMGLFTKPWEQNEWYQFVTEGKHFIGALLAYQTASPEDKSAARERAQNVMKMVSEFTAKYTAEAIKNSSQWDNLPAKPYIARLLNQPGGPEEMATGSTVQGLIGAALDTTAHAILWLMYNLATNPEVQERLYEEVSSVCKGKPLTEEDLKSIPYMKACMKESFRLNSVAAPNSRVLEKDVTVKGHTIPAGVLIQMSSTPVCWDDTVFPKAMEYIPERWLKGDKAKAVSENPIASHPYLILPFSVGARICLGARAAETEMMAFLSALIQKYKFTVTNGPCKIKTSATTTPDPRPIFKFVARN